MSPAPTIRVLPASSLSPPELDRWTELQESNPALNSPYFCAGYTQVMARCRPHVQVAVLEEEGTIVGFFPFERTKSGAGLPVGETFADLHGVISAPGLRFDAQELVRAAGLWVWDFDHLLRDQEPFRSHHTRECESPTMDLTGGFDAYCAARRATGSRKIQQTQRKARKLEREQGELRFVPHTEEEAVLDQLIEWKRQQCRRTGTRDYFGEPWAVKVAREMQRTHEEGFGGLLSALYVGDKLAAAHLGMWSREVCHWWFPVYDGAFSSYSPGSILLLRLTEFIAGEGRLLLELGKGGDAYKESFMTGARRIAEGSVIVPSLRGSLRRLRVSSEDVLRHSPVAAPVRVPLRAGVRWLRGLRGK